MAIKNSQDFQSRGSILLLGQSGAGKTFAAATLSAKFPHERVKHLFELKEKDPAAARAERDKLPWVVLDDLLWIPFDHDALDGLADLRISVPAVDYIELEKGNLDPDGPAKGLPIMSRIMALIQQEVQQYTAKTPGLFAIVGDTVSTADLLAQTYFNAKFPKPIRYDEIDKMMYLFYTRTRTLAPWTVFNFHLEALTDPIDLGDANAFAAQKLRQESFKMVGGGKMTLAVNRKARRLFQGNNSNQLYVECKKNEKGQIVRSLVTGVESASGVEARVRSALSVDRREPVDLHAFVKKLGKLA